jgi:hypothetical protein
MSPARRGSLRAGPFSFVLAPDKTTEPVSGACNGARPPARSHPGGGGEEAPCNDPLQATNLAAGDKPNHELVLAMNEKLNRMIDTEVGEDRGQMMPGGIEGGWEVSAETMKGF